MQMPKTRSFVTQFTAISIGGPEAFLSAYIPRSAVHLAKLELILESYLLSLNNMTRRLQVVASLLHDDGTRRKMHNDPRALSLSPLMSRLLRRTCLIWFLTLSQQVSVQLTN